jgi:hypothetical protein
MNFGTVSGCLSGWVVYVVGSCYAYFRDVVLQITCVFRPEILQRQPLSAFGRNRLSLT